MKKLAVSFKFPKKTGRVLDVGSGNNHLDLATHLLDLMPDQDVERGGALELGTGREFHQGSLEAIPFPDGFFDLVHASHVLEHVEDPRKAIAEIQRVGRAAYIETPAAVVEQGSYYEPGYPGWRFHRWYAWSFPGESRIYMKPKTEANLRSYCDCRYGRAFRAIMEGGSFGGDFKEIEPYIPYHCKMNQLVWQGREPIRLELWAEDQQGAASAGGDCNCSYAAFFSQCRIYFKTFRQFVRRRRFKSALPRQFGLVRELATAQKNRATRLAVEGK